MKNLRFLVATVAFFVGLLGLAGAWAQDRGGDKPAVTLTAVSTPSGGDEAQPTPELTPFAGVEGLNNRLNQLEKSGVVLTTEHNYLDLSDPSGDVIFKIGGNLQEDYRSYFQPNSSYDDYLPIGGAGGAVTNYEEGATSPMVNKSTSTFLNRKTRLDLITIFDHLVGFRYQAELGSTGYAIQDAYAFIKADPALQFQAGQFKVPVGLERLQNDTDNLFVERALPTDLVPNRDLGVEATGSPWNGVNYAVALTNGTPDNLTPNNAADQSPTNGRETTGRLYLTPFNSEDSFLKGLGFGISGSWAWNVNWNTNAYPNYFVTSLGQQQFFAYRTGVAPQGDFYHWSPQLYFSDGPFGLLGEYVQSIQDVGTSTANAVNLTHQAWQLAGSWVIGGKASYQGAIADKDLDLRKGQWGALEVAVRVHQLTLDPNAFSKTAASNLAATNSAQQATAYGAGLNWIFNPHFKLVFDWEETDFVEGIQVPGTKALASLLPEDVFTVRAQANF
jgi:phosphate-selective porin OprO and OprP